MALGTGERQGRGSRAGWPEQIREPLIERHLDPEWFRVGARERSNMRELCEELQRGGDLPDVPLIALTALGVDRGQALLMSKKDLRAMTDGKLRLDAALAGSVSCGEHRALSNATHSTINVDRPDAVIQAIQDLLARVSR